MAKAKKSEKSTVLTAVDIPIITRTSAKAKPKTTHISVPIPAYLDLLVHVGGPTMLTNRMNEDVLSDNPGEANLKPKNLTPAEVYERSKYLDEKGRDCIPAANWRKAFTAAAVTMDKVTKASLNREMVILEEMPLLKYKAVFMARHIGRLTGKSRAPRLIFRAQYVDWECKIPIRIMLNETTFERAIALFKMAGLCIGVGDWRPGSPSGGTFGTFDLLSVEVIGGTVTVAELKEEPRAA